MMLREMTGFLKVKTCAGRLGKFYVSYNCLFSHLCKVVSICKPELFEI